MHHVQAPAVTTGRRLNRVAPATQARRDQLLAALRDAGPDGLLTDQLAKAVTKPCSCTNGQRRAPVSGCTQCRGTGHRGCAGCEALPWLYPLERAGLIDGERSRPGSGNQVRWRIVPPDEPSTGPSEWWDALDSVAAALAETAADLGGDDTPPVDPAPLLAEWHALGEQRAEQLALAEGSREAQDDLVDELVEVLGSRKAVAAALGLPPHTVNNAASRAAWRRIKRERGSE